MILEKASARNDFAEFNGFSKHWAKILNRENTGNTSTQVKIVDLIYMNAIKGSKHHIRTGNLEGIHRALGVNSSIFA